MQCPQATRPVSQSAAHDPRALVIDRLRKAFTQDHAATVQHWEQAGSTERAAVEVVLREAFALPSDGRVYPVTAKDGSPTLRLEADSLMGSSSSDFME